MKRLVTILSILALILTSAIDADARGKDWVTTWATALQVAEPHNNPPEPYLAGNSFRQTLQVSIAGKKLRLHLSNIFNEDDTEILGVEIAPALTMGASPEVDESKTERRASP